MAYGSEALRPVLLNDLLFRFLRFLAASSIGESLSSGGGAAGVSTGGGAGSGAGALCFSNDTKVSIKIKVILSYPPHHPPGLDILIIFIILTFYDMY